MEYKDPGRVRNDVIPMADAPVYDGAATDVGQAQEQFEDVIETADIGAADKLSQYIESANIAELIDDDRLVKIGQTVFEDYELDLGSCSDWYKLNERGLELAKQVQKSKSFPWEGASNVVVPIITSAAISYNARVYPEIIRNGSVAEVATLGQPSEEKNSRARRVKQHLNYQLLVESKEWEQDTDRLTLSYAVNGTMYRKWYFDPAAGRLVSRLLFPDSVIINNGVESLESARRVSHIVRMYGNEVETNKRAGMWLDVDLPQDASQDDDGNRQPDNDPAIYFIEQHRWLDLDDDGLEEPYAVTIHRDSRKVVRIVARFDDRDVVLDGETVVSVRPRNHFIDYHFVPSFDGSFLSYGFGALLSPLNKAANHVLNSLLDAGSLSNTQGGFLAKDFRMAGGNKPLAPGEWRKTDIRAETLQSSLLPLPVKEPSQTLAGLFDKLVEMANAIVQVTNIGLDQLPANAPAASVLAVLEQNSKVFNSVFKRFYRSLTAELRLVFDLNGRYLDNTQYVNLADEQVEVARDDYRTEDFDITPVADPAITTQAQRVAMAQATLAIAKEVPGSNIVEASRGVLTAMGATDIDKIIPPAGADTIPPEVQQQLATLQQQAQQAMQLAQQLGAELQVSNMMLADKRVDLQIKAFSAVQDATLKRANAIKALAEARAKGDEIAIRQYEAEVDGLQRVGKSLEAILNGTRQSVDKGMALASGDGGPAAPAGDGVQGVL